VSEQLRSVCTPLRPPPDLTAPRRVHIVGVGGSGMSGIGLILAAMGHVVTGTDVVTTAVVPRLLAAGVQVEIVAVTELFSAAQAHKPDLIAHSTAFPPSAADLGTATEHGIDVLRRADILAGICVNRRTIAVSGTHGKTTTSSMLARVLVEAGLEPSYLVGGELRDLGNGAVWAEGEWFVVEADESDGTFVVLGAEIAVVTNVEADHLDHYGSMELIEAAFDRFLAESPGPNVVCIDEPNAARLADARGTVTYGTGDGADYRIEDPILDRSQVTFDLRGADFASVPVRLPVPGLYNARNATAAIATAALIGVPVADAAEALTGYAGVVRRFEQRGSAFGATLVDDYAHNPGKVAAVLAATRAGQWDRIVAVFQPHRYSRTAALARDFADSFVDADVLVLTDVYAAGEQALPGVSGKLLVDAVLAAHPRQRVVWIPDRGGLAEFLAHELRAGDLCLTLGAGNITDLPDEILELAASGVLR
jgi:UDP-N-acetylmuramate--alanine ligase